MPTHPISNYRLAKLRQHEFLAEARRNATTARAHRDRSRTAPLRFVLGAALIRIGTNLRNGRSVIPAESPPPIAR